MQISGRELQLDLIKELKTKIANLRKNSIVPTIAIVTLGPEESWETYVGQKIKLAEMLGINAKLINLRPKTTKEVIDVTKQINNDSSIHGLIVQRPFPTQIDTEEVIQSISKNKDVDGFRVDSKFGVPAWLAVKYILTHASKLLGYSNLEKLLSNSSILVVGKGGTAGAPVIEGLRKIYFYPTVIDSKTKNRDELFEKADIIISAVGRKNVVPIKKLKNKSILIGIGIHGEDGKLGGDFDQNEAERKEIIYTPTPGGVGPVNLAFLFKNLLSAARQAKNAY